jgi:hypothetical protein
MLLLIAGTAVPTIQQFREQDFTRSLTVFACAEFQMSLNDFSLRLPMLFSEDSLCIPLHGRISPNGSRKNMSLPAPQGNSLDFF